MRVGWKSKDSEQSKDAVDETTGIHDDELLMLHPERADEELGGGETAPTDRNPGAHHAY